MLKKLDWFIIILVAVFCLIFSVFSYSNIFRTDNTINKVLNIYLDGKLEKTFRFSKEFSKTDTISSKFGYNILEINNGEAYFKDANCKSKLCVKSGKISKVGDFIICLPHKLIIQIEGKSDLDAVSY